MINSFRRWYVQYNQFSKKDRNGIIILSILIVFTIIINVSLNSKKTVTGYDYSEFERVINEWELSRAANNNDDSNNILFPFNPNTVTPEELDSLALPDYVKRNLLSYREAGGKIRSAGDFGKIYGMNDSIFDAVKDFILFESPRKITEPTYIVAEINNNREFQEINNYNETNAVLFKIELNSTDSAELTRLNGIGPVFASRIIKYRDLLGGFYKKEQLLEVYNFSEETFASLKDNIDADSGKINKIRLNFAEFAELLRHPYLNREQVQAIINYRNTNGPFQSVNDLTQKNILDSLTFSKIAPYIY
ncbi:MAG: helix-hairpin-helix domain-containing protein [Bacteroidales bacterium]|jgi:DNA uptake protein ComE-like DNA-binding protein|nr:helix-hairpin-helix domain-containing protein [Bacteroidales bacterium]